tara:strand:+ start:103 stop:2220 length:2118 start_codon:yes stop_codon:yes gene_type:complete
MPYQLMQIKPGIVKDITQYSAGKNGPYWIDGNLVRFLNGYPQKIGGWQKQEFTYVDEDGTITSTETSLTGIARNMVSWRGITDGEDRIAIGTHNHLYILSNNALYDITPLRDISNRATTLGEALDDSETSIDLVSVEGFPVAGAIKVGSEIITYTGISSLTLTGCTRGTNGTSAAAADIASVVTATLINPIATTDESTTVTITDTAHGASDNDWVVINSATATGGIPAATLNNTDGYQITLLTANTYSITVPTAATSTVSAGGGLAVTIKYLVGVVAGLNQQSADPALGWGTGAWGGSTWGTARSTDDSDVKLENSQWSLNLWGEDLIATIRGGAMYYWDTSSGETTRASLISEESGATGVPTTARTSIISFPDRHVVALGADPVNSLGNIDPMLVRWSTQEDFTIWTPTATNTAGDQRLEVGTKIIGGVSSKDETFISSDEAVYGMTFIGPPFIFSFRLLATNCGAGGKNTMLSVDNRVYWMGKSNFFLYDGIVKEIPCPLQHFVFDRMQSNYIDKTVVGHNKKFNEVTWFYVSTSNSAGTSNPEPDSYVTFNYQDLAWSIGTLNRTVWSDAFGVRNVPFAFDETGYLYDHETGVNDNGSSMNSFVESSAMEISQGGDALYMVDKVIPDLTATDDTNLYLTLKTRKYPNSPDIDKGTFTVTNATTKVSTRARARQMTMKIESTGTTDDWSLGDFRVNIRQDGLR